MSKTMNAISREPPWRPRASWSAPKSEIPSEDGDLSVEVGRSDLEVGQDRGDWLEPGGPVIPMSGQHLDLAALDPGADAVSVDLDLVGARRRPRARDPAAWRAGGR